MKTLCCPKQMPAVYRPRRPEKTVLFEIVKKHYATWATNAEKPVAKYIDKTFHSYLGCGILAKGFACAHCTSCNKNFFIAFSCKGRGVCPSCNQRAMVETAANLIENVIPQIPVRQFVISFPKRIRHYLLNHGTLQAVLRIVIDEIQKRIIACTPAVSNPKFGAVSFVQHFGNTLNLHPHFHIVVADGLFNTEGDGLGFHEAHLTPDDILDTQESIQRRVLKYLGRRGFFDKEAITTMLSYENSGFSLDAKVRIEAWDREGLERLIRYCARPPFASENLRKNGPWIIYRLPKPTHTGRTFIQLEPLEFIDRIAKFIPYPRRHRRHYHGVFAPNSPLRQQLVAKTRRYPQPAKAMEESVDKVRKVSLNWAKLIARIYEINPLLCTCGKELKIVAFVTHSAEIQRILKGIGWPRNIPEFDPPYRILEWDICQLLPGTEDGFADDLSLVVTIAGPDPPFAECCCDPPHWDDPSDPPHWE